MDVKELKNIMAEYEKVKSINVILYVLCLDKFTIINKVIKQKEYIR